jgi:hypothetical protein
MLLALYSFVLGYLTAKVFAGPHDHQRGVLKSWIMHYHRLRIHVHHWIMGLLLVSLYVLIKVTLFEGDLKDADFAVIYFLIGIIVQGITDYSDWKEVVVS